MHIYIYTYVSKFTIKYIKTYIYIYIHTVALRAHKSPGLHTNPPGAQSARCLLHEVRDLRVLLRSDVGPVTAFFASDVFLIFGLFFCALYHKPLMPCLFAWPLSLRSRPCWPKSNSIGRSTPKLCITLAASINPKPYPKPYKPQTQNPKPQTLNPKPQTLNPKPKTL